MNAAQTQNQQPQKAKRAANAPAVTEERNGYKPGEEAVGLIDASQLELQENDLFESIPAFVPGKPGFDVIGTVRGGIYLYTKRAYSEKIKGNRRDETGQKYRDLHVFRTLDGQKFGLWSTGQLGATLSRLNPETEVFVRYEGLAAEALEEGQDPPHTFSFLTRKGQKLEVDWNTAPRVRKALASDEEVQALS